MTSSKSLCAVIALSILLALAESDSSASTGEQGMSFQGMSFQGMSFQGMSFQGMSFQGMSFQGMSFQGMSFQGMSFQGMSFQGMSFQGMSFQGMSFQGMSFQGMSFQGMSFQGMSFQGTSLEGMQLRSVDRLRAFAAPLELRGMARADAQVPGRDLQGLQPAVPINYVTVTTPMDGVQLQAGPADTAPGSYLFVPGLAGTAGDIKGSFWNLVLSDTTDPAADATHFGNVMTYIADVERDMGKNSSVASSNDDIWLYTVYYRQPVTGQWAALCPLDGEGKARAMVVPLNPDDWASPASRKKFAFACTASGVAAKCARNWGYKPWKPGLDKYYDACLVAARADYCQNDQSFTRDGTLVDLFDTGGTTTINPTVGLPYAPFSTGVMMHEEYQISVDSHVKDVLLASEYMSLPPDEQELVTRLLRSGLQSSRYPDLDPGRSCPAAPYIDRCDPTEPYACYRATNLAAQSYGPSLAVNSPRHCAHDEDHPGDPLDPLCNACVNRVCQVDPTCCGDPGETFYPRALVWDDRCITLRAEVCRSGPASALWPPGHVADPAGSHPAVILQGAVGSFEGIVTEGGTRFAEGWACDPDFPGASSAVQMSVGGTPGATGATLTTATADQPLVPGWRETVAAACGGAGRHGFKIPLLPSAVGQDVYVYGIDLNVPGAPFSLLRGGKKTVPGGTPAGSPRAAIWTGWIEPAASGQYGFCRQQPGTTGECAPAPAPAIVPTGDDLYRIWVNGVYVAGNWVDADASAPGAFTLPSPGPSSMFLQKGVRYPVRIEYLRPSSLPPISELALLWSVDGANPIQIPTSSLYPMAPGNGNGLQGTFFAGTFDTGGSFPQTFAAVDHLWTDLEPPAPGLSVEESFAARFEGQVVPPISGDYTFTADTDGLVRITVDGQLVTNSSQVPPGLEPETCAHDICATGAPVSRTCKQGSFCAGLICLGDPSCCAITWDARCAQEVKTVCGIECSPTPPIAIALRAGRRYDVKVEYQHAGGTADKPVRAAKLRLMWALPGAPRDVIPAHRLFAATAALAPGLGVGLNAAYFSDAAFAEEILDRVDGSVNFRDASPPDATRASGLACGEAGAPACGPGDVLGAPALASAQMNKAAGAGTVTVDIKGAGAVRGAIVTLFENGVARGTAQPKSDATDGGIFTAQVTLPLGPHELTAIQSAGGLTSGPSASLTVNVTDPAAPAPPQVSQPAANVVSGNGNVSVGGTATADATVTVTAKPRDGGAARTTTFTASPGGSWSGTVTLPPGSYDVTFTQTVAGVTGSAGPSVNVEVAIPPLTVAVPADGATFDGALGVTTVPVTIQGLGAGTSLGSVIVGDGDGKFFVDIATLANNGGAFSGTVPLDYGIHRLKIFQRSGGLDGDGVLRSVAVRPPLGSLAIKTLVSGLDTITVPAPPAIATVNAEVTVQGIGGLPRTGLPGTVVVYQGTTFLGEGPIDPSGAFSVPVRLAGAGQQEVSVSQTARSLSGGGPAESARATITVLVRPGAPTITVPLTGATQPSLLLDVQGTAAPGTMVTLTADGVAQSPTAIATGAGSFTVKLTTLIAGTHRLTATATADGASSPPSAPPVLISLGDITPPTVIVTGSKTFTGDESGAVVNLASMVSATDGGVSLPSSAISCSPALGTGVQFPPGSTSVTCAAVDAAGNRGATTFVITVAIAGGPMITGTDLVAEAQGPDGAVVNYQVSATGYAADCAPAGSGKTQACTFWKPAFEGLGMGRQVLVQNTNPGPDRGSLYTVLNGGNPLNNEISPLFRLQPGTTQWQPLPTPAPGNHLIIGPGSPPVLYASADGGTGIQVSADGGQSWLPALPGFGIAGIVADPRDASKLHQLAWRGEQFAPTRPSPEVFETRDGWATWARADQGLPGRVLTIAFDPSADRAFASVEATVSDTVKAKIFVREEGGAWQQLPIPPLPAVTFGQGVRRIAVAPATDGCGEMQSAPTVIADFVVYRKGATPEWSALPATMSGGDGPVLFDRGNPCLVFKWDSGRFSRSNDGARTAEIVSEGPPYAPLDLIEDIDAPGTFYLTDGFVEPVTSTDGGKTWLPMPPTRQVTGAGNAIGDLAVDPVDPKLVLLSVSDGMFRSTDGGDHWLPSNQGINDTLSHIARRILIDRVERNRVYAGYEFFPFLQLGSAWVTSPNSGGTWTQLLGSAGAAQGAVALDPVSSGHWFSVGPVSDGSGGTLLVLKDSAGMPGATVTALPAPGSGTLPSPSGTLGAIPYALQILPDAARTVMLSWNRDPARGASDVSLFPFQKARDATSSLALEGGGVGLANTVAYDGIGRTNVIYDGSDGTPRLFVDGSAIGKTPNVLYRTTLDEFRRGTAGADSWQPLGGSDAHGRFTHLMVDPNSGGQTMISAGYSNTTGLNSLWESHDAGRSWQIDETAPRFVHRAWLSPADGAIFAVVRPSSPQNPAQEANYELYRTTPGGLWKRSPVTGVPVGARIALGDVRVTCKGPGPVDGKGLPLRPASPGSTFPLGDTTVSCEATDVFGQLGTAAITITVRDTTPPVITVDTPPAPATAPAGGTVPVTFAISASDAVDGPRPVICAPGSGSAFPVGITTVTCTASDLRSPANTATSSFPVLVSQQGGPPLGAPTLTVPTEPVEATGQGGAVLVVTAATAGGATLTAVCTPAVGSTVKIGTTAVSCSATDPGNGLTVERSFELLVRDTTPPAITVPGDQSVAAEGAFGAHVSYTAAASDVVDGAPTPTCSPASGAVFPLGVSVVICRAVDEAGNQGFAQFKVTVTDQSQSILHLADVTVDADDYTGARVNYSPAPSATDISGSPVAIDCVPPTGTHLPLGDTVVSCTATPGTSHEVRGSFVVHVVDQSPPAVTVSGPITFEAAGPSGTLVAFAASARDLVNGTLVPACRRTTGFGLPTPVASGDTFPIGDNLVTCAATDTAGNIGSASFSVIVRDTTPPALTLPGPISVLGDATDSAVVTFVATAVDTVSGNVAVACSPRSGERFVVGATTVTCVARDASGNEARGSFSVTVTSPNTPPVVTVPGPITREATKPGGAVVTYTATATDAQDGPLTPICAPPSGSTFPLGTMVVTCVATDKSNASGTASFTVTVRDTTPPALTVPGPITVNAGPGGTAVVTYPASATDIVSGSVPVICAPPSGSSFAIGTTTVTCSATDAAGNRAQRTFTVTVLNTAPTLTVPANIVREATSPAGTVVTFTATASDAQDGPLVPTCTPVSGATFPIAVTTVTCRATDGRGVTSTATFTVTVRDTTGPVLTVPPDVTITSCAAPNIGVATAADAAGSPVTITTNKPATFPLGTTVVTYTARDARGNVTTATQRVTAILGDDPSCCPAGTTVIRGTSNNDTLTGTSGRDCIIGLGGQDQISGGGGDDVISGGDGNDIIDGGGGNDQIWGRGGQDTITGGVGNDVIDGGDGDDICRGGDGDDTLRGGNGQDQLFGENNNDQLFGDDGDDKLDGGPGNDGLNGGPGNDTCTGGTGTNTFTQCSP